MSVKELLIMIHTHTDFGFTDYPDTLLRHHNAIIDDALDLCEEQAHREEASQFRWTCEVSYVTANWFRQATDAQKDRFRALQRQGLMGVGAMPVHWTPLISPANAIRSLKDLHFLKQEGVSARVAIQCDVNGLSWFWTDLLLDAGVDSLLMQPNPHRAGPPEQSGSFLPRQTADASAARSPRAGCWCRTAMMTAASRAARWSAPRFDVCSPTLRTVEST